MTPFELQRFNEAVGLAQVGRKIEAHALLTQLDTTNPNDDNLLLWLAFTSDNLGAARTLLDRAARLNSANQSLASAYGWLSSEEAKQSLRFGNVYGAGATVPSASSPHHPAVQPSSNYAPSSSTTQSQSAYSAAPQVSTGRENSAYKQADHPPNRRPENSIRSC